MIAGAPKQRRAVILGRLSMQASASQPQLLRRTPLADVMSSSGSRASTHWLHISAACASSGNVVRFEANAWLYTQHNGELCWELRRFVLALADGMNKSKEPARLARKGMDTMVAYFEACGFEEQRHMLPSARAFREKRGRDREYADGFEYLIRSEASLTNEGLLLSLLAWAALRRHIEDRDRAVAILAAVIEALVSIDVCVGIDLAALREEALPMCLQRRPGGTCAHHVQPPSLDRCLDARKQLLGYFIAIAKTCAICPANARCTARIIEVLTPAMAKALPLLSSQDPLKREHLRGSHCLLRIDEDYKHEAMYGRVGAGRARSGGDTRAADPQLSRDSARQFSHTDIDHLLSEQWHHYEHRPASGVFSVAEDVARLGNPAEDTTIYAW